MFIILCFQVKIFWGKIYFFGYNSKSIDSKKQAIERQAIERQAIEWDILQNTLFKNHNSDKKLISKLQKELH